MNYNKKGVNIDKRGQIMGSERERERDRDRQTETERIMERLCQNTNHPGRNVNPFTLLSSLVLPLLLLLSVISIVHIASKCEGCSINF
jgi:hypothetical protein